MRDWLWPPTELDAWTWPASQLGTALAELAHRAALIDRFPTRIASPPAPMDAADEEMTTQWLSMIAGQLEVEAEPVQTTYGEVEQMLQRVAPALLRLPSRADSAEAPTPEAFRHTPYIGKHARRRNPCHQIAELGEKYRLKNKRLSPARTQGTAIFLHN